MECQALCQEKVRGWKETFGELGEVTNLVWFVSWGWGWNCPLNKLEMRDMTLKTQSSWSVFDALAESLVKPWTSQHDVAAIPAPMRWWNWLVMMNACWAMAREEVRFFFWTPTLLPHFHSGGASIVPQKTYRLLLPWFPGAARLAKARVIVATPEMLTPQVCGIARLTQVACFFGTNDFEKEFSIWDFHTLNFKPHMGACLFCWMFSILWALHQGPPMQTRVESPFVSKILGGMRWCVRPKKQRTVANGSSGCNVR